MPQTSPMSWNIMSALSIMLILSLFHMKTKKQQYPSKPQVTMMKKNMKW